MNKIKTKILCTIGPATWDKEVLEKMIEHGMTIARINGAYADVPELKRVADSIREISDDVALLLDIKGTEVRLNKFEEAIKLTVGEIITIGSKKEHGIFPVTYPELYKDLKPGHKLVFDDGKVRGDVEEVNDGKIQIRITYGNELLPGKSINTPGIPLSNEPITPIDIEQIKFAVEDNWDFVAASFVRNADDIHKVKRYLENSEIQVLAKIEDEQGTENFEEIIDVADGVIIARGDMGVEMPFEKVPVIQKQMTERCLLKAKPVIVATHMLESMIENPSATRAEINDVANAVFDGADSVWLSAETSKGKYPVDSVLTLQRICRESEKHLESQVVFGDPDVNPITIALAQSVVDISESLDIDKIIVATASGATARVLSTFKLKQPIIAMTATDTRKRQLQASWGITPLKYPTEDNSRDRGIRKIVNHALDMKLVEKDDLVLVIRGTRPISNKTNSVEVGIVKELILQEED